MRAILTGLKEKTNGEWVALHDCVQGSDLGHPCRKAGKPESGVLGRAERRTRVRMERE